MRWNKKTTVGQKQMSQFFSTLKSMGNNTDGDKDGSKLFSRVHWYSGLVKLLRSLSAPLKEKYPKIAAISLALAAAWSIFHIALRGALDLPFLPTEIGKFRMLLLCFVLCFANMSCTCLQNYQNFRSKVSTHFSSTTIFEMIFTFLREGKIWWK